MITIVNDLFKGGGIRTTYATAEYNLFYINMWSGWSLNPQCYRVV